MTPRVIPPLSVRRRAIVYFYNVVRRKCPARRKGGGKAKPPFFTGRVRTRRHPRCTGASRAKIPFSLFPHHRQPELSNADPAEQSCCGLLLKSGGGGGTGGDKERVVKMYRLLLL